MSRSRSFTLVEILIVITILSSLTTLASANFMETLKKSRDSKRKMDLSNIQRGLEMYYEDEKRFPASLTFGGKLCKTPPNCSGEKIYMQVIPNDPSTGKTYYYETDAGGTYYRIYSTIENANDTGQGVYQPGYNPNCGTSTTVRCQYGATSSNVTLLTPTPTPIDSDISYPTQYKHKCQYDKDCGF
jgi:general secretion pathway protein G